MIGLQVLGNTVIAAVFGYAITTANSGSELWALILAGFTFTALWNLFVVYIETMDEEDNL